MSPKKARALHLALLGLSAAATVLAYLQTHSHYVWAGAALALVTDAKGLLALVSGGQPPAP